MALLSEPAQLIAVSRAAPWIVDAAPPLPAPAATATPADAPGLAMPVAGRRGAAAHATKRPGSSWPVVSLTNAMSTVWACDPAPFSPCAQSHSPSGCGSKHAAV